MRYFFLYILFLNVTLYCQGNEKPVAKIGGIEISPSEFRERFEFTPWNKEIRSYPIEGLKKEFLYTLVAEKLFALKALENGIDTTAGFKLIIKPLEKMFVRDALYRLEIMDKVKISDAGSGEDRKTITKIETSKYYDEFADKFFADKKTDVNGKLYQELAAKIISIIVEKRKNYSPGDTSNVYLGDDDFVKIMGDIGEEKINSEIMKSGELIATGSDFLYDIRFSSVGFSSPDPQKIKAVLGGRLIEFMRNELLAAEGFKRELQYRNDVKEQLQIWKDHYLAFMFKNKFLDSIRVSEKELLDYYNEKNNLKPSTQVNIVEVLTDNLDDIEKVLNEKNNGADMHELAVKYSKREDAKITGGESGFFPVTSFGEIGRISASMKIGDIFGPLKVQEGYSIFELIDKKESNKQEMRPFPEVKEELRKTLQGLKNYHSMIDYTVKLAKEYKVVIDEETLSSINVTNIYSVMFRYFGFGGKILAAPLISPYSEWVKEWQKSVTDKP